MHRLSLAFLSAVLVLACSLPAFAQEPIKVFLLAGQSNMFGFGRADYGVGGQWGAIGSLRHEVANDPANYGHLMDQNQNWVVRDDIWVWAKQGATYDPLPQQDTLTTGDLVAGLFGYSGDRFGPELGIGQVLGDYYGEQVVLVKTAWNAASLFGDFRPPSSGNPSDPSDPFYQGGIWYQRMIAYYNEALVDIAAKFPGQTIELEGMAWNQGLSDVFSAAHYAEYETHLVNLINDVRADLGAPDLPFVIAETGNWGAGITDPAQLSVMAAQSALADATQYPQFAGNVGFASTTDFWRESGVSPTNEAIHWNHNGESYYLIGEAMGNAMLEIVPEPNSLVLLFLGGVLISRRRRND